MSKHTPGPWEIDLNTRPEDVCTVYNVSSQINEDGEEQKFVYIRGPIGYWDADDEERMANARLIAAAPDLLEALEDTLEVFTNYPSDWSQRAYQNANKAIAKAKGEA